MIDNRGIRLNGEKVEDIELQISITNNLIVQVGKRKFLKIKL
jgi:tyrosyl-tRNA synthetase